MKKLTSIEPEQKRQWVWVVMRRRVSLSEVIVERSTGGPVDGDIATILVEPDRWLSGQSLYPVILSHPSLVVNFDSGGMLSCIEVASVNVCTVLQLLFVDFCQSFNLLLCLDLWDEAWLNQQNGEQQEGCFQTHCVCVCSLVEKIRKWRMNEWNGLNRERFK